MSRKIAVNCSPILVIVLLVVSSLSVAGAGASEASISVSAPLFVDSDGSTIEGETAAYFIRVRADFGLDSSTERIQDLLDTHGIAEEWGFPMAPEELAEMLRRTEVQDLVSDRVIDSLESLPGFAGFYFDHQNRGTPTVLLTKASSQEEVRSLFPAELQRDVEFREASHTYSELVASAHILAEATTPRVHSVAVKVERNALELGLQDAADLESVGVDARSLTDIPVLLKVEPTPEPDTCSSRNMCYSPMRAGIRVQNEGGSAGTLGFGIWHNSDKQWLVSGHLTPTGSGNYEHYIFILGSTAENEFVSGGADVRAVYAPDSQVSDDIYLSASTVRDVKGTKHPSVGLSICLNGISTVSCGQVVDNYFIYTLNGVSNLLGAKGNYNSASGDSGGPIYQISGTGAYAVGAHSTSGKAFARMSDLLYRMGATILTS